MPDATEPVQRDVRRALASRVRLRAAALRPERRAGRRRRHVPRGLAQVVERAGRPAPLAARRRAQHAREPPSRPAPPAPAGRLGRARRGAGRSGCGRRPAGARTRRVCCAAWRSSPMPSARRCCSSPGTDWTTPPPPKVAGCSQRAFEVRLFPRPGPPDASAEHLGRAVRGNGTSRPSTPRAERRRHPRGPMRT